jgi:hypothetical protein
MRELSIIRTPFSEFYKDVKTGKEVLLDYGERVVVLLNEDDSVYRVKIPLHASERCARFIALSILELAVQKFWEAKNPIHNELEM